MSNITFLLFTFNEAHRVEYALRCIHGYGEIVLIDNYSTDGTVEIAKKYTDKIFLHKNPGWVENEETANFVLSKVNTDWVFWLYVDEFLPKKLLATITEYSKQDKYKVIKIRRKLLSYGKEIDCGFKDYVPIFFMKGTKDFKNNMIHGSGKILVSKKEILKLPPTDDLSIWHFHTSCTKKYEIYYSHISDKLAEQYKKFLKRKFSPLRLFIKPIKTFFNAYFIYKEYKNGWQGLFFSVQASLQYFNVEAKIWELENNISLESIESQYNVIKENMITGNNLE
jgi:glycosyltransferase involved in cell wall biosynthesis